MAVAIAGLVVVLLAAVNWSRLLRPVATGLVLASAFSSYFMWTYGVVIDSTMLVNVVHTDAREVQDLLSVRLFLVTGLLSALPLWWIWRRPVARLTLGRQCLTNVLGMVAGLAVAVAAVMVQYQGVASLMRNHKPVRFMMNPLNSVWGGGVLLAESWPSKAIAMTPVGQDAELVVPSGSSLAPPPMLLLVVGETARADNFGIGGYERATTPELKTWRSQRGLIYFDQVSSCGTNTHVSLPCIFSPLTKDNGGDETQHQENLLDVLQRAGLAVLWLDNQSGCKGVCNRVTHVSTREAEDPRYCATGECHDEIMLEGLEQRIAALDPVRAARGVVVVMHQMGSHGPAYYKRSPQAFKRFAPECDRQSLSECDESSIRNAYDNSIAYTDHFLGKTLEWAQRRSDRGLNDVTWVYVSDHGESLGEGGVYLHGVPYAFAPQEQTHVPMAMWASQSTRNHRGYDWPCLRRHANEPYSHDNVFHTVLRLTGVRTTAYNPDLDIVNGCGLRWPT
ncbi:phosphoethanolamine--lipid A transferase [Hydrogenophaga sp. 5NK40-0174]